MTKLLEEAFSRAKALPELEQDAVARLLLDEIESDKKWEALFTGSSEKLGKLADAAWAEHESGQSEDLDVDQL